MNRKQAAAAAAQAIRNAQKPGPAGFWCVSFDRRGRAIRMFVPANEA